MKIHTKKELLSELHVSRMWGILVSAITKIDHFLIKMSRPENIFIALFLSLGFVMILIVPPFQTPDEPMHFYRAYQLSTGNLFAEVNGKGDYGGYLPTNMEEMVEGSGIDKSGDHLAKFDINYKELLKYDYNLETEFVAFPNTSIYTPFSYLPSIISHTLLHALNGPQLIALYFARTLSLVFVALSFYVAIRIIPFGKWIMFAVGMLPMTIASASSVNADAMTIAVSVLLISITLYIATQNRVVPWRLLTVLAALVALVGVVKQAHVALAMIVFLIPLVNKKYREQKVILILVGMFIAAATLFIGWYLKTDQISLNPSLAIQPDAQKDYIMSHPFDMIGVAWQTFMTNNANALIVGVVGNFGWLTAPVPIAYVFMSLVILYFATRTYETKELEWKDWVNQRRGQLNVVFAVTFMAVVGLVSLALYLYWTPLKHTHIVGLQGRYFTPILPLLLMLLLKLSPANVEIRKSIVVYGSILIAVVAIIVIYARFYINTVAA